MQNDTDIEIKINLGCGGRPLPGYVNVDIDTLERLKDRYPGTEFPEGVEVYQYDIFNLPYPDGSVTEIRADSLLEHLSYLEEKKIFMEIKRALKPGGCFVFSIPDFEDAVRLWLNAKDDWKDFYRNDPEAIAQSHWFGHYSYSTQSRWGYLTASFFGPQNSPGQFHKNCYTEGKIRAIMKYMDFQDPQITRFRWKGDRNMMLKIVAVKK